MNTTKLRELLSKATPRPWSLAPGRILTGAEYERIVHRDHIHCDSDAALIVALVNNAEALLDEVERLRAFAASIFTTDDWDYDDWCRKARAALEQKT